jgi:hypothetical protein
VPATIRDVTGETRVVGAVLIGGTPGEVATVQANGELAPAAIPPPPPPPTGAAYYQGSTGAVADGNIGYMTWSFLSGDPLLDLTDPVHPIPAADGLYVVTAALAPATPMTLGGVFTASINGFGPSMASVVSAQGTVLQPTNLAAATGRLSVAVPLDVVAVNQDGVQALTFTMDALVTRIG